MGFSYLQAVIWGGIILGGMIDLYSFLLMLLRRPRADGGRPSPVFAVPVLLYLACASIAVAAHMSFPGGLVAGLVLFHLGVIFGVPKMLNRMDR